MLTTFSQSRQYLHGPLRVALINKCDWCTAVHLWNCLCPDLSHPFAPSRPKDPRFTLSLPATIDCKIADWGNIFVKKFWLTAYGNMWQRVSLDLRPTWETPISKAEWCSGQLHCIRNQTTEWPGSDYLLFHSKFRLFGPVLSFLCIQVLIHQSTAITNLLTLLASLPRSYMTLSQPPSSVSTFIFISVINPVLTPPYRSLELDSYKLTTQWCSVIL